MRKLVLVAAMVVLAVAAVPGVAQAAVISSWPLAADANDSADSNNGIATDVTFAGSAAVFNGTSSKISVPYNATLSPGMADVTASVEINTTFMPGTDGFDNRCDEPASLRAGRTASPRPRASRSALPDPCQTA